MAWVLIIITYVAGGKYVTHIPVASEDLCIKAKLEVKPQVLFVECLQVKK